MSAVKLALISDIHANLEALRATLIDIATRSVDRIVCLGDIVGYNTRPSECVDLIRRADALCVAGNHDLAACGRIGTDGFSAVAARAVIWTQRRLTQADRDFLCGLPLRIDIEGGLLAVHGALVGTADCATVRLDSDERRRQSLQALVTDPSGARICAFGHTHQIGIYEFRNGEITSLPATNAVLRDDAYYLINPGSIGQPRSRDRRASYMVLDLNARMLSVHRVDYDAAAALSATRAAGLAPAFSFVPEPVRGMLVDGLRVLRLDRPVKQLVSYLGR